MTRAHVRMIACVSLDGRVSVANDVPPNQEKRGGWTSAEDKEHFNKAVGWADLLIAGRVTAELLPNLEKPIAIISNKGQCKTKQAGPVGFYKATRDDLEDLLMFEHKEGANALLCGGAQTYALFLQHGLVDSISLTVEPVILNTGPALAFNGLFNTLALPTRFKLVDLTRINGSGSIILDYRKA